MEEEGEMGDGNGKERLDWRLEMDGWKGFCCM
jgi:hypothetical protein